MNPNQSPDADSEYQPPPLQRGPVSPGGRMLLAGFRAVWFAVKVLMVALVISMAAGQFVGLLGFFLPAVKSWQLSELSGYGWVAGAVLTIIGIPAGWVEVRSGNQSKTAVEKDPGTATFEPAGLAGRMAAGALFGAILFSFVAGMILLCWISLGRCPFLHDSWKQALRMPAALASSDGGAGIQLTGDDALLPVLFIFGALILGAICGAILLVSFRGGRVIWTKGPFVSRF